MKREFIAHVRLTQEEYDFLNELKEKSQDVNPTISKTIRSIIFSDKDEKKNYKKILREISQIKTELHHLLLISKRSGSCNEYAEEIQMEIENLSKIQKELIN